MVPVIVESSRLILLVSPVMLALLSRVISSIADIVRLISCSVAPPLSSVIKTEKESLPLKLRLGLYVHLPVAAVIEAVPLVGFLLEAIE